jgi:hypothetical protein
MLNGENLQKPRTEWPALQNDMVNKMIDLEKSLDNVLSDMGILMA